MSKQPNSVSQRLISLRKAMGYDYHGGVKAFAGRLGVSEDRWGNVERGYPLSRKLAFILIEKCPGVTAEWLWFGIKPLSKPRYSLSTDPRAFAQYATR